MEAMRVECWKETVRRLPLFLWVLYKQSMLQLHICYGEEKAVSAGRRMHCQKKQEEKKKKDMKIKGKVWILWLKCSKI